MRYGICLLPDMPWAEAKPLWQQAEQMGFDHAWTYDHLVWGGLPDARWFGCLPTLTAAAAATSTLKIGSYVISPNFRHPVALSRELQTLVDISDGRLIVGLGVGGTPDDGILGQPALSVGERVNRFQEFVRLLERTLVDDHVTFDGDHYSARDMRLVGGPVRPRLPLILAGDGPRQIRFAAREGDGWVTQGAYGTATLDEWFAQAKQRRDLMVAAAHDAGRPQVPDSYLNLDSAPIKALSSVDAWDEITGRAAETGYTDVIVHRPRTTEPHRGDVTILEKIAERGLAAP
ncbi:MAG: LLM class flavin-dependent oxidoreductase [Gordonia sp. (in: high G+C Gram-positive bacteria)]|uniref:LLM class flavin-dependent oxidoreductase n=1 Tax=Gordonia sp. (in: high G+C Gram-positive bacteria) TaxID=84139 RepID=UPI0039E467A6